MGLTKGKASTQPEEGAREEHDASEKKKEKNAPWGSQGVLTRGN